MFLESPAKTLTVGTGALILCAAVIVIGIAALTVFVGAQ